MNRANVSLLVAMLSIVGIGAAVRWMPRDKPQRDAVEILEEAAGPRRFIEGRTTLELDYKPYDPSQASEPDDVLLAWLVGEHDRKTRRALALFYVWRSEPGDYDRAELALEEVGRELLARSWPVSRGESAGNRAARVLDAASWNEWALVAMARGDDIAALEAIERALELDPDLLPAHFNRALVLERLLLDGQAVEAWERYVALDTGSGWARDALEHRARLLAPRPAPQDLESRQRAFMQRLIDVRDLTALEALVAEPEVVSLLGELAGVGERLLHHEIEYLRKLPASSWPASTAARTKLGPLLDDVFAGRSDVATLRRLTASPEPLLAVRALQFLIYDAAQRDQPDDLERYVRSAHELCGRWDCPLVRVLGESERGAARLERADFVAAARAFSRAEEGIPAGFELRKAEMLHQRGKLAWRSGAYEQATLHYLSAVRIQRGIDDREGRAVSFNNLGGLSRDQGHPRAARAFRREAAALAKRAGIARSEIVAGIALAKLEDLLGNSDEAGRLIESVLTEVRPIRLSEQIGEALLVSANLMLEERPTTAFERAREAEEIFIALGESDELMRALEMVSRAALALGERETATRALHQALRAADSLSERADGPLAALRLQALASIDRVLLARLLPPEEAWSLLAGAPLRPLDDDECMLMVAHAENHLGVWSATSAGTRYDEVALSERATPAELASAGSPWSRARCPNATRRLSVVENVNTVAGFVGRVSRLENPEVAVTIVRSPREPWPTRPTQGRALITHNPRPIVHEKVFPRLPAAVDEAKLIRAAFPGSEELAGERARPDQLRASAGAFDILHFSVHGESRSREGAASYLVLGGQDGMLQVVDVLRLDLHDRKPLVILSACKGGGPSLDRERDGAGLPWAFLEAGASAVIATQDTLDDRAALDFSGTLYQELARGSGLSLAFETALQRLRERWPPEVAAAFALYL